MADAIGRMAEGASGGAFLDPTGQSSALQRAVVVEVLHDLAIMDQEQFDELLTLVPNQSVLDSAPRNSCIVQPVGGAQTDISHVVCYPFFPPYLALPVKPGEHVWIFTEQSDPLDAKGIGYWLCRITEPNYVDDLNYTHSDRGMATGTISPDDSEQESPADPDDRGVGFPNGKEGEGTMTLDSPDKYEMIYSGSLAMQSVTLEPVPRFTKRPGDMVLQGSNNTCIVLGEDRGWTKDTYEDSTDAEWSNATSTGASLAQLEYEGGDPPEDGAADPNERKFAGTIDIVAGRGRYLPDPDSPAELTACRTITNSRSYDETDKNPTAAGHAEKDHNRWENPAEGDPDFYNDASRMYVSMNTLPDLNFSIEYPDVPPAGDANDGEPIEILEEFADGVGQAAIVIKSDEVRIIARQDMEQDTPIQGSITLIKEGTADDEAGEGRGIITIRPDGVIMIDGPKIVIGSGIEKGNGEGAQVSIGLGANDEPMVLGQQLVDKLTEFAEKLNESMNGSVGNLGAPVLHPVYAGWMPGWIASLEEIKSKVGKLL